MPFISKHSSPSYVFEIDLIQEMDQITKKYYDAIIDNQELKYPDDFNVPDDEIFIRETYSLYTSIRASFGRLKNIKTYLLIDPIPDHYKKNGIPEIEYYRYHVENFHIALISIIDHATLLINHCLRLGIPENRCFTSTVCENTVWKDSEIIKALKNFDSEFKEIRKKRNKIIHRGNFQAETLADLDKYVPNQFFSIEAITKVYESDPTYNLNSKSKIIANTITLFESQIESVRNHLVRIFETIIQPYAQNIAIIQKKKV